MRPETNVTYAAMQDSAVREKFLNDSGASPTLFENITIFYLKVNHDPKHNKYK
jgi:hypothetical protein